jgi:XFP C-terminal domain
MPFLGCPPPHLLLAASGTTSAYNKQGSINTPLELTIRNRSDRFGLTNDAIDCMPRFRVTGSSAHEALLNQQVAMRLVAFTLLGFLEKGHQHPNPGTRRVWSDRTDSRPGAGQSDPN